MKKLLLIALLPLFAHADVYLDARLGSVIGGKHSSNDGNLPFYANLGVDYGLIEHGSFTVTAGAFVGHRSNADLDGVLPDGGSETQDEHVGLGINIDAPINPSVVGFVSISAGKYIRSRTEEGYPLFYEAGIKTKAQGYEISFGWLQEEQIDGDYSLGSLGLGIRYNLMEF